MFIPSEFIFCINKQQSSSQGNLLASGKVEDWPEVLKQGGTVYDVVDELSQPGKGKTH